MTSKPKRKVFRSHATSGMRWFWTIGSLWVLMMTMFVQAEGGLWVILKSPLQISLSAVAVICLTGIIRIKRCPIYLIIGVDYTVDRCNLAIKVIHNNIKRTRTEIADLQCLVYGLRRWASFHNVYSSNSLVQEYGIREGSVTIREDGYHVTIMGDVSSAITELIPKGSDSEIPLLEISRVFVVVKLTTGEMYKYVVNKA